MQRIYAAMRDRLLVYDGGTAGFCLADHELECVAASPDEPRRAFCGTFDDGLYRTTDGGETWDRRGADALAPRITSVTVAPHDPDEVWVGTEPSAIYRSTDGGETWTERPGLTDLPTAEAWYFPPRPHTHHVRWIEVDPADRQRLYIGIEAGAFALSPDGGETFEERPPGARLDNHSLATHPDAPGRVYAAAGDGYAESRDGGETWDHPQAGLDHRYCWSVQPVPDDPDTVLLSAASGAHSAHGQDSADTYVYRRAGDGPWQRVGAGIPTGAGVIRAVLDGIETADGAGVYAVNNRGLYRSTDAGRTWAELGVEWPEAFLAQAPRGLAVV